jgi:ppGpp synthetase/RelA/SpoT-type nucleotidyltranferase
MTATPEQIRDDFLHQRAQYEAFADSLERLVVTLLQRHGIGIHSISHRVKDPQSLYEKLSRPGKAYGQLADVTDLAGLRIITFFPEDVDRVGELIENEFAIDRVNSIDKRLTSDPDRFGYASLHKVCSFSDKRVRLAEYAAYRGLKCEVQIRTILQHAWAEIEHDLGYKSAAGVPTGFRRRFSRVAALLECADDELMRLKTDLATYSVTIVAKVKATAPGVALDKVTLRLFVETNTLLAWVEANHRWSGHSDLRPTSADVLEKYVQHFKGLGVDHIDSLANALERHKEHIVQGAARCEQVDYGPAYCNAPEEKGWSLWMLIQLLCADKSTLAETVDGFKAINLWIPDSLEGYAESLRGIVRQGAPHPESTRARDYKSVYVTFADEPGTGNSFPLELRGDKWLWENIAVTDEHVTIDGNQYPIGRKVPLYADIVHRGKRFIITE